MGSIRHAFLCFVSKDELSNRNIRPDTAQNVLGGQLAQGPAWFAEMPHVLGPLLAEKWDFLEVKKTQR